MVLTIIPPCSFFQQMIADRDKHATLIARQSRSLLRQMIRGLWDFMEQLDLDELETDEVIDEMIEFVRFMEQQQQQEEGDKAKIEEFQPSRVMDHDTLKMKLSYVSTRGDLLGEKNT